VDYSTSRTEDVPLPPSALRFAFEEEVLVGAARPKDQLNVLT
jgi:hypothetical protein